jgi:sarcosine oxidase subunit beta
MHYSLFSLARNAFAQHRLWPQQWRNPEPKSAYDIVIVGGGGHGLATAFYLAKEHGLTNIALLEKGWLGGGNTGRNTTIVRSNYLWDETTALYEHALKLWEGLSEALNYNVMFSQRGVVNLAHNEQDLRDLRRRVEANRLNGVDSLLLDPQGVKDWVPQIDISAGGRYPVLGASLQKRGGTARHDAVAWGYARAADSLGVDIIQNCEVTGFRTEAGKVTGLETSRGSITAGKVGLVTAGHTPVLAALAGLSLPLSSVPLQALVSEPVKPCFPTVVMSGAVHGYVSQSDKGELVIGAGADQYVGFGQKGSAHISEETLVAITALFPIFRRMKMLRSWGGIVDIAPDASPILSKTPIENLFINCGWGTGGFKATPGSGHVFADLIARGEPNDLTAPFALSRFETGYLIDEHGAAGVAH